MNNQLINNNEINNMFDNIKELIINNRNIVYQTVNTEILGLYWKIGKAIMKKISTRRLKSFIWGNCS